ncbi:NAD-dependent epimerase/dehydratase family protein [Paracoccus saliphilus]|uniref:NAD(P)-dependent oxidoreductase n=1 Tax=Paracoccus saliphilus TaxID=405559 RepID=A0AA45W2N6_9RHOB|nr:NAD(P)-dependent oxidoreductase [Paracoccus saliphilus]WCR01429.1 NAD(P)-dependent oxidoreductase [Paracoccus saliphilus]SIS69573.1 uronate dehydrogenase [Paracoccus saliphilus]
MKRKLLVTGAAGIVGTGICPLLAEDFDLRLSMRRATESTPEGAEVVIGDIADPEIVARAVEGCHGVLHLAAVHGTEIGFEETLDVNYRGVVALMEKAVAAGVCHVIFASSNHGWGMWPRDAAPLADTAPPRPDGWYGVSKIFGESVMAYYADTRGIATTSLRIGNCGSSVEDERRRHMWMSFRDMADVIRLALRRETPGHRAVFATADCKAPFFDNAGLRELGFETRDRPDDHLHTPQVASEQQAPGMAGAAIGGAYAEANFCADRKAWEKS